MKFKRRVHGNKALKVDIDRLYSNIAKDDLKISEVEKSGMTKRPRVRPKKRFAMSSRDGGSWC